MLLWYKVMIIHIKWRGYHHVFVYMSHVPLLFVHWWDVTHVVQGVSNYSLDLDAVG